MEWLKDFMTPIQLISAVNFVYIVTHLPGKIYNLIFDEERFWNYYYWEFINQISADMESLKAMEPIETKDGKSNSKTIENLKERYDLLIKSWNSLKESFQPELDKAKNVKGFKCLFLIISLYCIIILLHIPLTALMNNNITYNFNFLFNILIVIYAIKLTYVILGDKWRNKSNFICYSNTFKYFIYSFIAVLISVIFNEFYIHKADTIFIIPEKICNIAFIFNVLIPFYPCFFSLLYIIFIEKKIYYSFNKKSSKLKHKQYKLHEEKINIDKIYSSFDEPSFS